MACKTSYELSWKLEGITKYIYLVYYIIYTYIYPVRYLYSYVLVVRFTYIFHTERTFHGEGATNQYYVCIIPVIWYFEVYTTWYVCKKVVYAN